MSPSAPTKAHLLLYLMRGVEHGLCADCYFSDWEISHTKGSPSDLSEVYACIAGYSPDSARTMMIIRPQKSSKKCAKTGDMRRDIGIAASQISKGRDTLPSVHQYENPGPSKQRAPNSATQWRKPPYPRSTIMYLTNG